MDYGLIQNGTRNFLLRNDLFYKKNWIYYTAMILNLMGRFAWVLTISPDVVYRWIRPEFFLMVIYMIEMCRRGMWNFFRIELKHIDLCNHFQVSDKIALPSFAKIKELISKEELRSSSNKDNKKERKMSLNKSNSSIALSVADDSHLKVFNNFLNDFNKKANEIEKNETNYYKMFPSKEEK